MASERKIRRELERRAELLAAQGLGAQAAEKVAKGDLVAIRCFDYSDIGPVMGPFADLRTLRALVQLQERHPDARPYYLVDYHWRGIEELDEDDYYTDEVSVLYLDAEESKWEAEREALESGEPIYLSVRFVDEELVDGDGDCEDYIGSFTPWHSGIGEILEITYEDDL